MYQNTHRKRFIEFSLINRGMFLHYLCLCLILVGFGKSAFAADMPDSRTRAAAVKRALARMTEYRNPSPEFSFKYPKDWNANPSTEERSEPLEKLPPPFVFKAETNKGIVNVGITIEPVPADMSLDQFVKATLTGIEEVFKANSLKFTIVSQKNIDIHETPGCQIVLLNQMSNFTARQMMLLTMSGGKGVCITCSTADEWYPQYEPLFQTMIESTKFTKQK